MEPEIIVSTLDVVEFFNDLKALLVKYNAEIIANGSGDIEIIFGNRSEYLSETLSPNELESHINYLQKTK